VSGRLTPRPTAVQQKCAEPVALSSSGPADTPLALCAAWLGFVLPALRARRSCDSKRSAPQCARARGAKSLQFAKSPVFHISPIAQRHVEKHVESSHDGRPVWRNRHRFGTVRFHTCDDFLVTLERGWWAGVPRRIGVSAGEEPVLKRQLDITRVIVQTSFRPGLSLGRVRGLCLAAVGAVGRNGAPHRACRPEQRKVRRG
jgi:hypothetical protein